MSPHSQGAFFLSLTLHAVLAALALFFGYFARTTDEPSRVLELVAGEGDNFMATEAPALGSSEGIKVPAQPRTVAPVEPTPAPPVPVSPPAPTAPTTPAEQPIPNLKKTVTRAVANAEAKAKREIAKERAAEKKREEEDKKRLTKEEFDRQNKAKSASTPTKVASAKAPKVDAEGIAKGVVGGSTANKLGGAGGKAMTANPDSVLEAYYALFKNKVRAAFEAPPGLSDSLKAAIEFRSNPDGSITAVRVSQSSGVAEFDRAVLEAVARVKMPARPDKHAETLTFTFSMRDRE